MDPWKACEGFGQRRAPMQQQELGRFQACSLLERLIDQAKLLYQVHSVLIDFRLRRERALAQTERMMTIQAQSGLPLTPVAVPAAGASARADCADVLSGVTTGATSSTFNS